MHLPLLPGCELGWNKERVITHAEGACQRVFALPSAALLGRPLHEVLKLSEGQARSLDQKARPEVPAVEFLAFSGPPAKTLRFELLASTSGVRAGVLDLTAALEKAPPVQISRLSSSLSHEIRNPLSSVKMAVQTVSKNPQLSERDQKRLGIAHREIRTMERMLWLLSEYGRDTSPALEAAPLRGLVQETIDTIALELTHRKIELCIVEAEGTAGGDVPPVRADSTRLRPVLAQLFLNVAQGHPEGARIEVRLGRSKTGGAELRVLDPSTAILPEERHTLFEPFGSRLARGAGLSLAALKQVMLGHEGELSAEGNSEPGTVFVVRFPA